MKEKIKIMNYKDNEGEISLLLYGDIDSWGLSAKDVVTMLSDLEKQYDKINLRINSCGGSVFEGIAIYNAVRMSKADITIYVDGIAASMASVIALCGKKVYMSKYAQLMIHCVSGSVYGNTKEIETTLEEMKSLEATIVKMYAEKTGLTEEEITEKYMDGKDHWISAEEAVSLGFVDGMYDTEDEPEGNLDNSDKVYRYYQAKLQTIKSDNEMIEKIKQMASFDNCQTDEDVLARIGELEKKAAEADSLRAELEAIREAEQAKTIDGILEKGIQEHRLTQAMADNLKEAYKDKPTELKSLVDAMQPKEKVVIVDGEGNDSLCSKSWDELDKAGELAILKAKYPDVFQKKFEEKFKKE